MGFVPPQRPGSSLGFSEKRTKENGPRSSTGSETSKLVAKPASTSTIKGKAKAKDEGSDDGVYEGSDEDDKTKADPNGPLRTCVAFVDVRTAAGENSGGAFAHMLKKLGAKVCVLPPPPRLVVHILTENSDRLQADTIHYTYYLQIWPPIDVDKI
jgi:hypothetical protein